MFIKNKILQFFLFLFFSPKFLLSQNLLNPNETKFLLKEYSYFNNETFLKKYGRYFDITLISNSTLNDNLPNLENQNGIIVNKGMRSTISYLFETRFEKINFSVQPNVLTMSNNYPKNSTEKLGPFSVLNDSKQSNENQNFSNLGFKLNLYGISTGYGNWNQWWGPGVHNSLILSNNAAGFYHFYIETETYKKLFTNILYKIKIMSSNGIKNYLGAEYFITSAMFDFKIKNIEFGLNRNIVSGGYPELKWNYLDAIQVIYSQENLKYWDKVTDYYISYKSKKDNFIIFLEYGVPDIDFLDRNPNLYPDHGVARNIGLRKYGILNNKELMFGFEYTRLVQSTFYNSLPSPNWYDNPKNNYFSYNGKRWAAHSGSDSDDLLIFFGYISNKSSILYGVNYERHGVTYKFPPEVKFESRLSLSHKIKNMYLYLYFEKEYYEHYGFVDTNINVWNKTFENGSIQRTNTLLFSIEHELN